MDFLLHTLNLLCTLYSLFLLSSIITMVWERQVKAHAVQLSGKQGLRSVILPHSSYSFPSNASGLSLAGAGEDGRGWYASVSSHASHAAAGGPTECPQPRQLPAAHEHRRVGALFRVRMLHVFCLVVRLRFCIFWSKLSFFYTVVAIIIFVLTFTDNHEVHFFATWP